MNDSQEQMLKDVHRAIVGDDLYGHMGLIQRTKKTEEKIKGLEKKALLIGAAGAGALMGLKGIILKILGYV